MIATEKRTLHFDLSHIPAATEFWLSAGAADYPLVRHTDETRRTARATNRALALVPDDHVTHHVRDIELPGRFAQLLMVHSAARVEGSKLPTLELTQIHLPTASRKRAVALRHRHKEHPSHKRAFAKLADHGIEAADIDDPVIIDVHDWITAMDAAVTLVFFHQEPRCRRRGARTSSDRVLERHYRSCGQHPAAGPCSRSRSQSP